MKQYNSYTPREPKGFSLAFTRCPGWTTPPTTACRQSLEHTWLCQESFSDPSEKEVSVPELGNTRLVKGELRNLTSVWGGWCRANSSSQSTHYGQAWCPVLLGQASFYLPHPPQDENLCFTRTWKAERDATWLRGQQRKVCPSPWPSAHLPYHTASSVPSAPTSTTWTALQLFLIDILAILLLLSTRV